MPLMVYEFVKGAMKRYGRPVTTDEVINYTENVLPMCVDHVAHHLVEIYRKGLVKRKLDPKRKGYVWWIEKPESVEALAQKYPELFLESVYYHRVSKVLSPEKPMEIEDAMKVLRKISDSLGGKKPTLKEIMEWAAKHEISK